MSERTRHNITDVAKAVLRAPVDAFKALLIAMSGGLKADPRKPQSKPSKAKATDELQDEAG